MNELLKNEIKNKIIEVRGKKVILASDLAKLFNIETKRINENVKRNRNKFSNNDCFQVDKKEYEKIVLWSQDLSLRSQTTTLNENKNSRGNHLKYLPYVFTSNGIEVLVSILKSSKIKLIAKEFLEVFDEENSYEIIKKSPEIQEINIQNMIYKIRKERVILDYDLANLYEYSQGVKALNQAVKRNIKRFPKDFYFQLTEDKFDILRSQIVTANKKITKQRTLPYVFTEHGVAMLASILKTDIATNMSIKIIRTFVAMRQYLENNNNLMLNINNINNRLDNFDIKFLKQNHKIEKQQNEIKNQNKKLEELFKIFNSNEKKELIFMNGEVYDSYSKIIDIMSKAQKNLIIIDNYADKSVLDMLCKIKINITLIIKNYGILKKIDIEKYNKQYHNLKIIYSNNFHDHFIIIDKQDIYHLGASINHAGSKVFAINQLEEKEIKESLMHKINSIL